MQVVGIVCEYNPFHNGHKYQLDEIRRRIGECVIICAMSGSFTQRGELAIMRPSDRAAIAIRSGADIVFELPVIDTVRSAEAYALGGVRLLDALNVCDCISFGCEDVSLLQEAYKIKTETETKIRDGLNRGETYAKACGLPNMPNLILGVMYLCALAKLGSQMEPLPIERVSGDGVLSASALRALIRQGAGVGEYVPPGERGYIASQILREAELDNLLLGGLRASSPEVIGGTLDISEGLENLIYKQAFHACSRGELIMMVKSKRYVYTRISRVLTQFMLGITKERALAMKPDYARLLGFRDTQVVRALLSRIGDVAALRVISKTSAMRRSVNDCFMLDVSAAAIAALGSSMKNGSIMEDKVYVGA